MIELDQEIAQMSEPTIELPTRAFEVELADGTRRNYMAQRYDTMEGGHLVFCDEVIVGPFTRQVFVRAIVANGQWIAVREVYTAQTGQVS